MSKSSTTKDALETSTTDGAATPRLGSNVQLQQEPSQVQSTVTSISDALDKLDVSFRELNEKASQVENLGPTSQEIETQLRQLHQDVDKHKEDRQAQLESVKKWIREDAKETIVAQLKPDIKSNIQSEIVKKVKEEVGLQFKDHVPISLEEQLEETEKQLREVKVSLDNSEARRLNNTLDMALIQDEPLYPILKVSDGKPSDLYPADLISLLCYDSETMKKLMEDYDLPVDEVLQVNFNRFMAHIGIKHQLLLPTGQALPPPSPPPPTAVAK
ncbi:hypothetical protein K435DRAFT_764528 [Dendrothele bispora CBS 962.96]|uniref:Uncharacterized protein n=1 Tax=Dendrothele bispora (strain CBS 962.96) TaxID=1314807 RepID=A0A4S8L8I3_DENBC|nr:hypothetical protein K435DRAFT_764528 [Dendrothele bispora CBS 962.96]